MLWRMLAISTVLIALFSAAVAEVAGARADFQQHKELIGLALGGLGLVLLGFGKWRSMRRASAAAAAQPPTDEPDRAASNAEFLGSLQYWGPMLMLFAAIIYFANPPNLRAMSFLKLSDFKMSSLKSASPEKNADGKDPEKDLPVAAVEFPPMKMQGVTAGRRPGAIINAKIYFIGDHVGEAVVTAIDQHSVTLEAGGQSKVLTRSN